MITNNENILNILSKSVIDIENKSLTVLGDNTDLSEQFISFKMSTEGSLYTRNMRMVEIELQGKHELMNKWVHIQRYIANYNVDNGNLQTIDYGHFGIVKQEYDDTTNKTRLVAYDKMILTQIPYNSETMNLTYPLTVSQVVHRLAIVCNIDLVVNTTDNIYELVHSDLWANQSFTYADILEHVAQLTGSMFSIIDNKLTLHKPQEYDFTIQGKFNNLKMNDKYGKANILNISQEPQHYNNYQPDNALDIPLNDRIELVFINNPIFSLDPTYWKRKVFPLVNNVEYQTFNSSALGYGIFDVGDIVNVYEHGTDTTYQTMITKETFTNNHSVVTEIESHKPFAYKGQYVVETDQKRQGQETYFIVDQQNGVIEGLVRSYNDLNDKTAQLRIDVDSITTKVENIHLGNLIPNFNMYDLDMTGWTGVGKNLRYVKDLQGGKMKYYTGLRYSFSAIPNLLPYAMSEYGLSFFAKGEMISPIGHRVPKDKFSWKGKINNFSPFTVKVYEYNSSMTLLKTTPFNFNNNLVTHELSLVPHNDTQFFRIGFIVNNATVTNRVQLYDMMFNANEPQDWFSSSNDVMIYAQTTRTQLSDRIDDVVSTVEVIDGQVFVNKTNISQLSNEIELKVNVNGVISAINLSQEQVKILANHIALEGLTTINGHFKVLTNGDIEFTNAKGTNVNLTGTINATSGKISDFVISDGGIVGTDVSVKPSEIKLGQSTLKGAKGGSLDNNYLQVLTPQGNGGIYIDDVRVIQKGTGGTTVLRTNYLFTTGGNAGDIGADNARFQNIYLLNQPNVSSDKRYKYNVHDIDPLLIKYIGENIKPKGYRSSNDDKWHFGYIAQDIERALYKYCLEVYGYKRALEEVSKFAVLSKSESYMSLLYGELNVIIEAYNRLENEKLKSQLDIMQEQLNLLLEKEI